jgi:hypothetical protein
MPHFAARSALGAIALLGLASMKSVVDCHRCNASSLGTTCTGLEGGWDLSISIGVTNGRCHPLDGNPAECVAEACLSTILVSGTGPAHGGFTVCYEQTGAPQYCVTPAPSADSSGNVNLTLTKRTGCGNQMTYEATGPNGESKAPATMECKECLP